MKRTILSVAVVMVCVCIAPTAQTQTPVYTSGEGGYDTYRIPAVTATKTGTLLAFCEGRRDGRGDSGNIDLLVKRSLDRGATWSAPSVVWDDAGNTCGNPSPVVDQMTGTIWLLMTWNRGDDREPGIIDQTSKDTRRIFVTHSKDDGTTWAEPVEITEDVKKPNWTWYATGPGAGIQLSEAVADAGRMIVPCDHIEAESKHYYSHVIYSDDGGETWQLGGRTPDHQVNECQVVELSDGRLMLNMRNYDRSKHRRQVAFSYDGGESWSGQAFDPALPEPICQASIRVYETGLPLVLFSNPADPDKRVNMTVRLSENDGETWPRSLVLHEGPSAYSDLVVLPGGNVGCLYERGDEHPYETITFATFALGDVTAR